MVILFVLLFPILIFVQGQSPLVKKIDGNRKESITLAMNKSTLARNGGSNGCWMKAIQEVERLILVPDDDAISYKTIPGIDHSLPDGTAFCASLGKYETQTLALRLTVCHRTEHDRYLPPACTNSDGLSPSSSLETDAIDTSDNETSTITNQECLSSLDEGTFHMYTHFLRDTILICNELMGELNILRRRDASIELEAASLKFGDNSRLMDRKIRESLTRLEQIEARSRKMDENVRGSLQRQQDIEVISKKMEENVKDTLQHQEKFIHGMAIQENMTASVQMDMEAMKKIQETIFTSMSQQDKFVAGQQHLVKNMLMLYENTGLNQVQNTWGLIKDMISWNTIILCLRFVSTVCGTIALRLTSKRFARALPLILFWSCFKLGFEYLLYKICRVGAILDKDRDQGILLLRSLELPIYTLLHIFVFLSSFGYKQTGKKYNYMEDSTSCATVCIRNRELQDMQDMINVMKMQMEFEREARKKEQEQYSQDLLTMNQRYASLVPTVPQTNRLRWQQQTYNSTDNTCLPPPIENYTRDMFHIPRESVESDDSVVVEHPQFVHTSPMPEDLIRTKRKRDTLSNDVLNCVSITAEGSSSKKRKKSNEHQG